jgi:galactokinase
MPHWSNYVKGAVLFAVQKHGLGNARGFDFLVSSTIPPQGGSSSSSALVVLAGAAFRQANELAFTHAELAADSAQAEWYVGTRGGALDHTAICLSAPHHVVHLTYENQQTTRLPLPDAGYRWVTFFSHSADKGHAVMLAYNERAAVARLVIPALLARHAKREDIPALLPETMALTDLQQQFPDQFMRCQTAFPALVQERGAQPLKLRERARHHVGEIRRVEAAVELLRQSRDRHTTMQQLGTLLDASHASLRDLYEVSTPRVNQLYEILRAAPNVLGARLIGGGFGGNVLALTPQENVADLIARVQQEYYAPQQRDGVAEGAIMVSTPGAGLSEL